MNACLLKTLMLYIDSMIMVQHLSLRGQLLCPVFCFCSQAFSILRLWGRNKAYGGRIKAQFFAFTANFFPFYGYGAAVRPAGAALKPSILLFKLSNFHFTLLGARLGLRGGNKAKYFAF